MPYESLNLATEKPILSWANHDLGQEEAKMARNTASVPCIFKPIDSKVNSRKFASILKLQFL
jgi:tRNA-splicing ligase RtcB